MGPPVQAGRGTRRTAGLGREWSVWDQWCGRRLAVSRSGGRRRGRPARPVGSARPARPAVVAAAGVVSGVVAAVVSVAAGPVVVRVGLASRCRCVVLVPGVGEDGWASRRGPAAVFVTTKTMMKTTMMPMGAPVKKLGKLVPTPAKLRKPGRLLAYKGNCRLEPLKRLDLLVRIMGVARHFHLGVWGWSITRVHGNSRNPKSRPRYTQSRNWPQAAGWKPDVGPEP